MSRSWTKKKLVLSFFVALAACTPSFDAASDVNDLRILAIQAEPAEAQYDQTTVDAVHVRILAVDPGRTGAFSTMKWDICAQTDSRRCDNGPIVPQASGSQSRNRGEEFTIDLAFPAAFISQLVGTDSLGGYLGTFRAQLSLSVDDGDPHAPVYGEKVLVYSKRGPTPNHNPTLKGVDLSRNADPAGSVAPGQTLQLPVGVEVGFRPLLADGAREQYDTVDLRGNTVHLTEQPRYSFFTTTGGEFDRDSADEPADGVAPPDGLTRFDAFRPGSGTIWIVVRDGRGGESWIEIPWESS